MNLAPLRARVLVAVLLAAGVARALPGFDGSDATHRVAIVSWSSEGARGKPALPGSRGDAEAIASVLHELGGTASTDILRVPEADTASLLAAFREAARRFRDDSAAGVPTLLVFYHAGHADPQGLDLGRRRMPWARLREAVSATGARVRLSLLDACASGSVLRARGGRFAAPLPAPVRGEAWILSSRAEEASIETDSDGGGIFTRILVGGLRGAADSDGDGRITFEESFRQVSAGVRERARALGIASQTPQWASSLEGDRPLVLTRVDRAGSSTLEFGPRTAGILVSDSSGNPEAWIPPDTAATRLVLPPGLHSAWTSLPDGRRAQRIRLAPAESRRILSEEFVPVDLAPRVEARDTALRPVPVNFGLLSPLTLNGERPELARNAFSLDLVLGDAGAISGFQMAGILTRVRRDVRGAQFAGVMNIAQGDLHGFQLAGVNILGGGATGLQTGLLMNLDEGDSRGAQVASLLDVNRGGLTGAQLALGSCYAGRVRGGQISLVNVAGSMTGFQAGLLNIARESRGVQAGIVNVSLSSSGAAFGLVNVAPRSRSLAVGIVNVGRDLSVHPVVGVSDGGRHQVQVRYGTSWWRSVLILEAPWADGLFEPEARRWGLGAGASYGRKLAIGADALVLEPEFRIGNPAPALQANVEWRLLPRLAPGVLVRWLPSASEELAGLAYLAF